jgi:hypothetical protein
MKLTVLAAASIVLIAFFQPTVSSAVQQPEQPEDREIAALLKAAPFLEEKPFDAISENARAAAMKWIIDTDKVSVTICGDIFSPLGQRYRYSSEILSQYTIGMAAFKLAQPAKRMDENAVQLAGIESALAVYKVIVKERTNARSSFMDDLLAKQTSGELPAFAKKNNCVKLQTA